MRTRIVLLVCALFALTVGVATATAGGGNSANAHLCQKGGWQTLFGSDGSSFASEEECVSYGARGGTLTSKTKSQIDCEAFGGTFSTDPATDHNNVGIHGALLWSCNGADPSNATGVVLSDDCFADGGGAWSRLLYPNDESCYWPIPRTA
jgi:hypothetical protein